MQINWFPRTQIQMFCVVQNIFERVKDYFDGSQHTNLAVLRCLVANKINMLREMRFLAICKSVGRNVGYCCNNKKSLKNNAKTPLHHWGVLRRVFFSGHGIAVFSLI